MLNRFQTLLSNSNLRPFVKVVLFLTFLKPCDVKSLVLDDLGVVRRPPPQKQPASLQGGARIPGVPGVPEADASTSADASLSAPPAANIPVFAPRARRVLDVARVPATDAGADAGADASACAAPVPAAATLDPVFASRHMLDVYLELTGEAAAVNAALEAGDELGALRLLKSTLAPFLASSSGTGTGTALGLGLESAGCDGTGTGTGTAPGLATSSSSHSHPSSPPETTPRTVFPPTAPPATAATAVAAATTAETEAAYAALRLPSFLRQFEPAWVRAQMATVGVNLLERRGRHADATAVLLSLLSGVTCPERRGMWYERATTNMSKHLGRYSDAMRLCDAGLADPWVRCGDRIGLQRRALRLARRYKNWRITAAPWRDDALWDARVDRVSAKALNADAPDKNRYCNFTDDGGDAIVSVEDLALAHYAGVSGGGWRGIHSEGRVWATLFGVLLADELLTEVPGVFRSPFQCAPLDLVGAWGAGAGAAPSSRVDGCQGESLVPPHTR